MAMPATTDYWVNDLNGDPVFFVTAEANEGLSIMLRELEKKLKKVCGDRRLTFVFDRGGWSPKLFVEFFGRGVDILTYRKGDAEPVPEHAYLNKVFLSGTKKHEYRLFEEAFTYEGTQFRQVIRARKGGGQTEIITTRWDLPIEEVAFRMFNRWRQENYFKYMKENYALDALADYGEEDDDGERTVPNPAKKKLSAKRGKLSKLLKIRKTEYADLDLHPKKNGEAKKTLLRTEIEKLEQESLHQLRKIKKLPERVALATTLKAKPIRLFREKKRFMDSLRMNAYRLETVLAATIRPYYSREEDEVRALVRSMFQLSGELRMRGEFLDVILEPMSSAHRTRSLEELCRILNREKVAFPGSRLTLRFSVRETPVGHP